MKAVTICKVRSEEAHLARRVLTALLAECRHVRGPIRIEPLKGTQALVALVVDSTLPEGGAESAVREIALSALVRYTVQRGKQS